jgi:hypothetical protein
MELLTCPACGCSVQVADVLLGRRVRCFTCQHSFVAEARPAVPPPLRHATPAPPRPMEPPRRDDENAIPDEHGPFCPSCGRRIDWKDLECPYCAEELEPENEPRPAWQRAGHTFRRDYEAHRGPLIVTLGNLSMIVGGLSLCSFGFGAIISVPLGLLALEMANRDLQRIRDGQMDPHGKLQTESGRTGAITGIILGLIFGSFYALVFLSGRH